MRRAAVRQYGIDGEVRLETIESHLCGCSGSIRRSMGGDGGDWTSIKRWMDDRVLTSVQGTH